MDQSTSQYIRNVRIRPKNLEGQTTWRIVSRANNNLLINGSSDGSSQGDEGAMQVLETWNVNWSMGPTPYTRSALIWYIYEIHAMVPCMPFSIGQIDCCACCHSGNLCTCHSVIGLKWLIVSSCTNISLDLY